MKTDKLTTDATTTEQPKDAAPSEDELLNAELSAMLGLPSETKENDATSNANDKQAVDDLEADLNASTGIQKDSTTDDETETSGQETGKTRNADEAHETNDDAEETQKGLDERLEAFEKKYKPEKKEADSPRAKLSELESTLQQKEAEVNTSNFLDAFPQSGIFAKGDKTIYEMRAPELNDYIVELQDKGRAFDAAQIQTQYFKAVEAAQRFSQKLTEVQQLRQHVTNQAHAVEWNEIREEVLKVLPEINQNDLVKADQYIQHNAQQNPVYANALSTKKGKMEKGVEALEALGILKALKAKANPEATETKQPTAPDARAGSKTVRHTATGSKTYRESDIVKMPQAQFNKFFNALSGEDQNRVLSGEAIVRDS